MVQTQEPNGTGAEGLTEALTPRELEVLQLVSAGSTNSEIGAHLGLSVHAVKFHLASVYRKLGVANRTEAAVALLTAGAGAPESAELELT
jgi:DNA-binding CsgD family transcriptional regulator